MADAEKPLVWIGSSKEDLLGLPAEVVRFFGHALDFAPHGDRHEAAKVLKGFGGGGVCAALLPEEKQKRNRSAAKGYGCNPRPAENRRRAGQGDASWQTA